MTEKGLKVAAADARAMVLAQLRLHNYTGKTTELSEWTCWLDHGGQERSGSGVGPGPGQG